LRSSAVFNEVKLLLVGRQGDAVRPVNVTRHNGKTSGLVEAIYIGRQFLLIHDARIVPGDAVNGIGEPDRIIGLDHDIIGRIEALAVEPIGQHGDGSVIFGARDAAAGVLASDKPALPIASGDKPGAEALSGLARAFFYAGARALLVSHWSVDSEAATRLTPSTFAIMAADPKLGRAAALRNAMLTYKPARVSHSHARPTVARQNAPAAHPQSRLER
jgi:CHAT domain